MRIDLTDRRAKTIARKVSEASRTAGGPLGHGKSLDALSRGLGYRDWNALCALIALENPSPESGPVRPGVSSHCPSKALLLGWRDVGRPGAMGRAFGMRRQGEKIYLSADAMRRNLLYTGKTGHGMTEMALSQTEQAIKAGTGALMVQDSGDVTVAWRVREACAAAGRAEDFMFVDLCCPGPNRWHVESRGWDPFGSRPAEELMDVAAAADGGEVKDLRLLLALSRLFAAARRRNPGCGSVAWFVMSVLDNPGFVASVASDGAEYLDEADRASLAAALEARADLYRHDGIDEGAWREFARPVRTGLETIAKIGSLSPHADPVYEALRGRVVVVGVPNAERSDVGSRRVGHGVVAHLKHSLPEAARSLESARNPLRRPVPLIFTGGAAMALFESGGGMWRGKEANVAFSVFADEACAAAAFAELVEREGFGTHVDLVAAGAGVVHSYGGETPIVPAPPEL